MGNDKKKTAQQGRQLNNEKKAADKTGDKPAQQPGVKPGETVDADSVDNEDDE